MGYTSSTYPRQELKNLLINLGLRDPHGILFKEMLTWFEGATLESKSMIRSLCQEKLEEIVLVGQGLGGSPTGNLLPSSEAPSEDHGWCLQECPWVSLEHYLRAPYKAEGCTGVRIGV